MSPRTKMVIINSPGNPTGAVYTRDELQAIANVAIEEEILILSDEIYEKLVYDDVEHISIGSLSPEAHDLTITINGFSKSYAMTGWRLGYLGAPDAIAKAIDSLQSHSTSHPCSFAQKGALAALTGDQQAISDMRDEFQVRRDYMYDRLSKMPNLTVPKPGWGVLHAGEHRRLGLNSTNFSDRLLSKAGVAVVPGVAFGDRQDDPPELRDEPGRDQARPGQVRGLLPQRVSTPRRSPCAAMLGGRVRGGVVRVFSQRYYTLSTSERPVQHGFDIRRTDRLAEIIFHPGGRARLAIFLHGIGGQGDDVRPICRSQACCGFAASPQGRRYRAFGCP